MKKETQSPLKIAIIGAGIGGCASAYLLRHAFGDDNSVDIHVYEKSSPQRIGGRIDCFEFQGRKYEYGATILHSSNRYMNEFAKICGLKACSKKDSSKSYMAFYDSTGILVEQTGDYFGIVDLLAFAKRYGLFQLYKLKSYVKTYIDAYCKVYDLQEAGVGFRSSEEFLRALSPRFYDAAQTSLYDVLANQQRFQPPLVDEIPAVACLTNYGQSPHEMNAFCGLISLAVGFCGELWSIAESNKAVPIKLIELARATLYTDTIVKKICPDENNPEALTSITFVSNNGTPKSDSYDYVIIACPLHSDVVIDIDFATASRFKQARMQQTNTYFVYGRLKMFADRLPAERKRIDLLSVEAHLTCRSIATQKPCDFSKRRDKDLFVTGAVKLYKIFSHRLLDESALDELFERGYELVKFEPWLAYPRYARRIEFERAPPIIVDDESRSRVFYNNALEWCASCMEMECVAARNLVNLIALKEKDRIKKTKFFRPKYDNYLTIILFFVIASSLLGLIYLKFF